MDAIGTNYFMKESQEIGIRGTKNIGVSWPKKTFTFSKSPFPHCFDDKRKQRVRGIFFLKKKDTFENSGMILFCDFLKRM